MTLIKKTTKEKVNNHKQSDVIEKGARAFAKSLLEASKTAEKIEKQSHKKTDTKSKLSESKTIKISEKLISKEMESLIKKSGHSAEISELLNIVTPQVLETINAIASNSKSNSALTKSVQIPVFKNIAKEEKFLVGSPKDNLEKTTDAVKKGLISATVKAEIKEHPHQDIFAKTINSSLNSLCLKLRKQHIMLQG